MHWNYTIQLLLIISVKELTLIRKTTYDDVVANGGRSLNSFFAQNVERGYCIDAVVIAVDKQYHRRCTVRSEK